MLHSQSLNFNRKIKLIKKLEKIGIFRISVIKVALLLGNKEEEKQQKIAKI